MWDIADLEQMCDKGEQRFMGGKSEITGEAVGAEPGWQFYERYAFRADKYATEVYRDSDMVTHVDVLFFDEEETDGSVFIAQHSKDGDSDHIICANILTMSQLRGLVAALKGEVRL